MHTSTSVTGCNFYMGTACTCIVGDVANMKMLSLLNETAALI